ncbi:hypothetical protein GS845_25625 [Rhodococcus hoagii]|nr:hypothetical protein [Prescottella equi]
MSPSGMGASSGTTPSSTAELASRSEKMSVSVLIPYSSTPTTILAILKIGCWRWVRRPIVINDGARISTRSMILPGVTIGEGAVIGAGSLVTKDVEPHSLYYGVPAVSGANCPGRGNRVSLLPRRGVHTTTVRRWGRSTRSVCSPEVQHGRLYYSMPTSGKMVV